jgi:transposase
VKQPEDVQLSREEGEALIERIERNALSTEDRQLLVKLLTFYFWLLFALREAKLSLKRLKALVFGEKPKKPKLPPSGGTTGGGNRDTLETATSATQAMSSSGAVPTPEKKPSPPGHGRHGADVYRAAQTVECRHEQLAVGERCPACGRGTLYRLLPGVAMRLDGHALLSAVRYELEKLRCSSCGHVFTASVPVAAGTEKYTARARAILALGRYYLGLPWYRLEGFQALVGVPVADATQWDQAELVGDCSHPIFKCLETLAAQGEVIFQDDTPHRILTLIEENQQAQARAQAQGKAKTEERTGRQTTALMVQVGVRRICLYYTGRRHAGENLTELLRKRESGLSKPLVMSDALSHNNAAEDALIRCHCLAHGRRKFSELDDAFPVESAVVVGALKDVFDHDEYARTEQMTAQERLGYHQRTSGPILKKLKRWLDRQLAQRFVEPNSSLGKAILYMVDHWATLTRFLTEPGAPIDNNLAERALKLMIRQRKNSLFYATEHSAYIASILTSVIATCVQAGVNAVEYLVAIQEHRQAVFANPKAWLPWKYEVALVPS